MTTAKLTAYYKEGEGLYTVPLNKVAGDIESLKSELDGLTVLLFRGQDGRLVVEIDGSELGAADLHAPNKNCIPNIRLYINEQRIEIAPGGELIVDGKTLEGTA